MRQLELGVGSPPKKGKGTKPLPRRSPQAPGQYLGYSLQTTRLLQILLDGESGATYSLELFEDVGEEQRDGHKLAIQTKSTSTGNPIADNAEAFWKTFSNWVDAVEAGTLPLNKTTFELYVSAPKTGQIAELFHRANNEAEARAAIGEARKILSDRVNGTQKSNSGTSRSLSRYAARFFAAKEETIVGVVRNFQLVTGSGRPQKDLRYALEKKFVPPEFVEAVLYQALGWIKNQTDSLLEQGRPAAVGYDDFRSTIIGFVRKCSAREILVSWARRPSPEAVEADLLRTYVRQIELIDCDDEEKFRAINDFLRASVDRTNWSRAGMVHPSSFDEFEEALTVFWRNRREQNELIHKRRNQVERGKLLYFDCGSHRGKLEGLEVPDHFTPGSFHALADAEEVGWHPDYKKELCSYNKKRRKGSKT